MAFLKMGLKPDPPVKTRVVLNDEHWKDPRFANAPEVVPGTGPEIVPGEAPEVVDSPIDLEKTEDGFGGASSPQTRPPPRPWWKRKVRVGCIVLVILLLVGLGVGLGVALTKKDNSKSVEGNDANNTEDGDKGTQSGDKGGDKGNQTNGANNTTSTSGSPSKGDDKSDPTKSPCQSGLCQSVLSVTNHENTLYVFARTNDDKITLRTFDGEEWDDPKDMGKAPSSMASQPSSYSWKVHPYLRFPRLDLWTVAGPDYTAYRRHYTKAEGWTDWEAEGEDIGSPIAVCGPYEAKMDVFSTSLTGDYIYHDWWFQEEDKKIGDDIKVGNTSMHGRMSADGTGWAVEPKPSAAKTAPAVVCRAAHTQIDVLWYDRKSTALVHSASPLSEGWTKPKTLGGEFIGDPTVVSFGSEEWDFFGVQADNHLYHLGFTTASGYSAFKNLNGSIISAPTVVSLSKGVMDVVALGKDGNLKHMHYDGANWGREWENLGIAAHSAPTAVVFKERVHIMSVASDGRLMAISRPANVSATWKDSLQQETLGADLSWDGFVYN